MAFFYLPSPLTRLSSNKQKRSVSLVIAISATVALPACTAVKVGKRSTATAIIEQRTTALTGERLSRDTQSRLLQAGLDADNCLQNMPLCLVELKNASLADDKGLYGVYSELFYVAASKRKQGLQCETTHKDLNTDFAKQLLTTNPQLVPQQSTNNNVANTTTAKKPSCQTAYQDDLLQTARFAYIYLMYDSLAHNVSDTDSSITTDNVLLRTTGIDSDRPIPAMRAPQPLQYPPNERDIQIQDLYYVAIDELGDNLYEKNLNSHYQVNNHQIQVDLNGQPFTANSNNDVAPNIARLVSSYQINLSGLNSISRRDGFGMNYVAVMDERYTASVRNQLLRQQDDNLPVDARIHALGHLPMTALLLPEGQDLASLLSTKQFKLALYDPYQFNSVPLFDKTLSLSANFSASYGLWLGENSLDPVSLLNLFSRRYQTSQPHLFMLEPYNPNKRVIIMLHGLASSPATWIGLTNDIFNDPKLRDNYQVWQVFYPTNIPILENRYQIKQLLDTAFAQVDPHADHPASRHAVIIGHSMGGLIGRMLVSNDDLTPKLTTLLKDYQARFSLHQDYRKIAKMSTNKALQSRFVLNAMPQVDRAVFISSPFKGTNYADKWFTRGLRRIIALPKGFVTTVSSNLRNLMSEGELTGSPLSGLFLENGASQLSDQSFFVKLTQNLTMVDRVKVNTIIATDDKDIYDALSAHSVQTAQNGRDTQLDSANTERVNTESKSTSALQAQSQPSNLPNKASASTTGNNLYDASNLEKAEQKIQQNQQLLAKVSEGATNRISDGIVPYDSAHLDNVESEKILSGKHNVHTSPQAILELRRILHRQLDAQGQPSDNGAKTPDVQP